MTAGKLAGFAAGTRESCWCFVAPSSGVAAAVACTVARAAWRVPALASARQPNDSVDIFQQRFVRCED